MIFKNAELYNVCELLKNPEGQGYLMNRIPESVRQKLGKGAQRRALFSPGCEIRFVLKSGDAKITLMRCPGGDVQPTGIAEIYHGCFQGSYKITPFVIGNQLETVIIKKPENLEMMERVTREYNLPFDPNVFRIMLPYDWMNILIDIEGDITPPTAEQVPKKKILCYGSSITHGGSGVHPGEGYAAKLAQLLGFDLINMGFAGNATMDAAMADYIAEREWDVATIEMGINVIDSWDADLFKKRVDYFVERIASGNPDKLIICTDLYTNSHDYDRNPKVDVFRDIVRSKVEALNMPKLLYVSGRELLKNPVGLTSDFVHPSSFGMESIAYGFYDIISRNLA